MDFTAGQKVIYRYDNSVGTITGKQRSNKWEVKFNESRQIFLPAEMLDVFQEAGDMIECFENGLFSGINDLKRILYKFRLSGELTNIIYSMSNSATQFMPHQFIPVTKYLESYTERLLIADEVGLGKTIESMYIWEELRARKSAQRLLIVVPAILRFKWKSDLEKYFSIDATIVNAQNPNAGESLIDHIQKAIDAPQKESFALIISLEGLRIADRVADILETYKDERQLFDLVIIDEAHYLRNSNTKSFKTGALLRDVSDGMLLLSATPIQTGSENFFNLLRLLSEEEFYNRDLFEEQLQENYPLVQLTSAIDENSSLDVVEEKLNALLRERTYSKDPYLISLQDKIPLVMSSTEKRIEAVQQLRSKYFYDNFVTRTRKRDVIANRTERKPKVISYSLSGIEKEFYDCVTQYLKGQSDSNNKFNNFRLIVRQRQMASCMPAALKSWRGENYAAKLDDNDEGRSLLADLTPNSDIDDFKVAQMPTFDGFDYDTLRENDTKFKKVLEMIDKILMKSPQEKIIIFSFFRGTVDYLYHRFLEAGIRTTFIRGGMNDIDKNKNLTDFRELNINILVSTEVGSEGIDLQFAKYEINYDLPWNPMRLEQRIGRIDRIGQKSPSIYIINSFCEDTIEDRILSRLYERIQIFKDSIGDLEEILGNVIQELELDVFLNDYQTAEDIERRTLQVEQAIKNNQRINRNLEIQSGMLSAYQNFVLDSIVAARNNYRMITSEELIYTIGDFLNNQFPGSVVERSKYPDCAKIMLSSEARDSLIKYINTTAKKFYTRLDTDRDGVMCAFNITSYEKLSRLKYKELIDINHPLVKWMLKIINTNSLNTSGCSMVKISRSILPEAANLPAGVYTYFIQVWKADGVRRINELHYFINPNGSDTPITGYLAETILTAVLMDGETFDSNMLTDEEFAASAESVNILLDYSDNQFKEFEDLQISQNHNTIREQESYIERTFEKKIQNAEETLRNLQYEGKSEQVLRMWRGKIEHIKQDKEDRIRRLRDKFECQVTFGDVAIGILVVTGD